MSEAEDIEKRMEEIRLKNEQLEKKHREIKEDEEQAIKEKRMVEKKDSVRVRPKESHRYDNVELDYDVKSEQKEHIRNPDYQPKNSRRPILAKKQLDEIPPDPVNFLREDDGTTPKPEINTQNSNNNNRNRKDHRPKNNYHNNNNNNNFDNSSRQGFHNQRPRPQQQQNQYRHAQEPNSSNNQQPASPRKPHPQQIRSERRSLPTENPESDVKDLQDQQANRQQRRPNNRPKPQRPNRDNEEKNNITVQVTDGEVRSVKLKTGEKIGSGRVARQPVEDFNPDQEGKDAKRTHKPRPKKSFKPKGPPQPEFQHPILDKIVIPKTSVQERLLRSKMDDDKDVPKAAEESSIPQVPESN